MQGQMKRFAGVILGALALTAVPAAVLAQMAEPIVGTWKLDVAKSTYKPGPAPKSQTIVVEQAGKGVKVAIDAVNGGRVGVEVGLHHPA